jgi:hypothetical protein
MFVEHEKRDPGISREHSLTPMKLSEAIREGAKLRPQGFGELCEQGRTCALGAAIEGVWGYGSVWAYETKDGKNCIDLATHFRNPHESLYWDITTKNDHEKWSRERIADWLESQGY